MSSETHNLNDETKERFNKVLNRVLKEKYDWFRGIVIKSLHYKESRAIYLAITADIYIDSEWGYKQWLRYNHTKQFPFGGELSFGEIVGGNLSEELQDDIFTTFLFITGVRAQRLSFEWFDVHLIDSENKELHENIHRIKEVMGINEEREEPTHALIEILPALAHMDEKYRYQVVPHHATKEDKIYIKKGSAGHKTISTKNIKVINSGSEEEMKSHLSKLKDKEDSSAKWVKCKNCNGKFTQTIHKGKKSLPICPTCGTHN